MKDDKELYEEFLRGNKDAFNQIIDKYKSNLVYFITRYVNNIEIAEDIFQDMALYILENKEKYDFEYSLKTYMYMIAKSRAVNYINKNDKIIEMPEDLSDENLLEEIICSNERKEKIQNVMNKLQKDYQLVIYLTQIEGLSYKETARIMDRTEGQIKTLAHNSKKKLKKLLQEENVIEIRGKRIIILLSTILFVVATITGVTYADEIIEFVKELFGANSSDGVDIAVNNGFVAEGKTEEKSEGITVNIKSFIMDDYNFGMNFLLTFNDKYDNVNEIAKYKLLLEDLKIVDENNKIVFSTDYERKLKNDPTSEPEYRNGYSMTQKVVGNNQIMISVSSAAENNPFPKSKKLNISFTRITLKDLPNEVYKGDWKFEENVPEEMYNRETIIYKVKSCSDDKTIVEDAMLSNTAFKISIPFTTTDKIDYEALYDRENMKSIYSLIALQKEYVETSDGKCFDISKDGTNGYGGAKGEKKIIDYHQTFNLTKFDATDIITAHIYTNTGEEIVIEFEKVSK